MIEGVFSIVRDLPNKKEAARILFDFLEDRDRINKVMELIWKTEYELRILNSESTGIKEV